MTSRKLRSQVVPGFDHTMDQMRTWLATRLMPDRAGAPSSPPVPTEHPKAAVPPSLPLQARHLRQARLFADREDLITSLHCPEGGVIAEIGVALGEFSDVMLRKLRPKMFVAFDTFTMHHYPSHWGTPSEILFDGLSHLEFYRRRFSDCASEVVIEEGMSHERLPKYEDRTFDLIYIDAGHDYESVHRDAELSKAKLKENGVLVFNDYIMYDHVLGEPYGIVPVVNEMVVNNGWQVVGLGLQKDMFCDIAIRPGFDSEE